ncbi:MAG: class I SAM-dependent methyltransferase [Egibacteraceae bacterium]
MTGQTQTLAVPWEHWVRRWDAQQEVYIEARERCYDVMFSFVEALLPDDLTVLDLAAGCGAISRRILRRLPKATSVAVEVDPVMLRLGEGTLGDLGGRLRWVKADLREPGWPSALGQDSFDVVMSTTATHWLRPPELAAVYRQVAQLLRPGGVLLNGDGLYLPNHQPRIRAAVEAVSERRQARAVERGAEVWDTWWEALRAEPSLRDAFAERDRIFPPGPRDPSPKLAFHEAALLEAGFEEVGVVWQDLTTRVLLALR